MPLTLERFVGAEPGPHVLITGGVHGDEYEPMMAVTLLIDYLVKFPPTCGTVTLIPVVNEPAYRRRNRVGDDGLDLARTCPGRADGSDTEQIAHELSELIRTADYYIDLHTGGTNLEVLPMVGYTLHPDAEVLEKQRRMAHVFGLPIVWGTTPNLNGRTLSVARDAKVPAIYAEYFGGGRFNFDGSRCYFDGCLRVLKDVGVMSEATPIPEIRRLVVEDASPDSGHMQVNHPAPHAGFFQPEVALGEFVRTGDRLGTIFELNTRDIFSISARYTGIVLVLYTAARVDAGTSVAVILPTDQPFETPQ